MAEVKTKKSKVVKVVREGITSSGLSYKMFTISEGHKQKDGTYNVQFFNCFATEEKCEKIEEGAMVVIEGNLMPNNYKGKDGNTIFKQTLFVNNCIVDGFNKGSKPKAEKEEAIDLPFD